MKYRLFSVGILIVSIVLIARSVSEEVTASVDAIMSAPDKYSGKQVRVVGVVKNGHLGSFLEDKTGDRAIRLRLDEKPQLPRGIHLVRDQLYDEFWAVTRKLSASAIQNSEETTVQVIGIVRVLRRQPGRESGAFDPYIEGPVEFIPIRVLKIERKPNSP